MTEIQGKSILVRVSARLELARVRVIGSRLYVKEITEDHRRKVYKVKAKLVSKINLWQDSKLIPTSYDIMKTFVPGPL